ncbi:MAG: hypothetical protein BWX50_01649 [Euryarchaeota archaeon ADurb.Bin009]|nr:MAG: hypothetical protein BWX50_01649 [Euryarchaeota archaeon ADurb.Bin009]
MRARRAHAFPLEVDLCRGLQGGLEPSCPVEGAWSPEGEDIPDLAGDIDVALRSHLLPDQFHRKYVAEVIGNRRFPGRRVEGRIHGCREIRLDVIPPLRHLPLVKEDLRLHTPWCVSDRYIHCGSTMIRVVCFNAHGPGGDRPPGKRVYGNITTGERCTSSPTPWSASSSGSSSRRSSAIGDLSRSAPSVPSSPT